MIKVVTEQPTEDRKVPLASGATETGQISMGGYRHGGGQIPASGLPATTIEIEVSNEPKPTNWVGLKKSVDSSAWGTQTLAGAANDIFLVHPEAFYYRWVRFKFDQAATADVEILLRLT